MDLRGLPFLIGPEPPSAERCLLLPDAPVSVAIGRLARRVIVAHRLLEPGAPAGHAVGQTVAEYAFHLAGVRPPVAFHVAPAHPAELDVALPDRDGGRRQRGDRRIRGRSFGRSPAGPVVLAGQRLRIGRHTPVHVDIEDAVPPVLRHEPHRTRRRTDERVLIDVAGGDAGDDEPATARDELELLDRSFGMRIFQHHR